MVFGLITAFIICVGVVVLSLPLTGWRMIWQNCQRRDGSISRRRIRRECSAIGTYLSSIILPLLLVFLPLFLTATILFTCVIPYELIVRTFQQFDVDFGIWKEQLTDVKADHAAYLQRQAFSDGQVADLQRMLWTHWPLIGGIAVVLTAASIVCFMRCARASVITLATGIRKRRAGYWRTDMARSHFADHTRADAVLNGRDRC